MTEEMRTAKQLREKIHEAVESVTANNIGVAFSGGIDSSLLAQVCANIGKNATLLTVGFSNQRDIEVSTEASKALDLHLSYEVISLEELEDGLRTTQSLIEFDRIVRLENCMCFYYVFRLASKQGLSTVLSANGMDELFCGYHVYTKHSGDEKALRNLMATLVEIARKDKEEVDKMSALFGVDYVCPFLSDSFVDFAIHIPSHFKIKSESDRLRKHILREVALEIGVPRSAALRAKKAFQYSSGIHKAIKRLARRKGFTRQKAKAMGLSSAMEAYVKSLQETAH